MTQRLPVTIITGFLGSGKTTLMRRLLRDSALSDAVVVVNEFGEVGLDHLLVGGSADDVLLLDSGCLCCTMTSGLGETLASLYSRRAAGSVSSFNRVVVETSGLADPAPLLQVFLRDPFVKEHFMLDALIATIDAVHGAGALAKAPEAGKQALFADRILLTKVDACTRDQKSATIASIVSLNPEATVVESVFGDVNPLTLLDLRPLEVGWPEDDGRGHDHSHDHSHDHGETHAEHGSGVSAHTFRIEGTVTWPAYAAWLEALSRLPSEQLLRVKGILSMAPGSKPYVIQGVHSVFARPERLEAGSGGDPGGWITFIVRDLERDRLEESLDRLGQG